MQGSLARTLQRGATNRNNTSTSYSLLYRSPGLLKYAIEEMQRLLTDARHIRPDIGHLLGRLHHR